jgi:hypothetical protein
VTARLSSPLAGEPPHLDALLEWALSPFFNPSMPDGNGHFKITRDGPAPPQGAIQIPLAWEWLGPWMVRLASSPIMPVCRDGVDHYCKRIATEASGLLAENERKIVSTTNSWTKSYRLPLRIRSVPLVRWACVGTRREIRKALRDVHAIGKKTSYGYGRVAEWIIDESDTEYSWFAPHQNGHVLMRPIPVGEWLPSDLVGARRHFGACTCPYWHPSRFCEIICPC